MTVAECILTKLLNCGTLDLELLEDINYDLNDILDDLMENGCLHINAIFESVFLRGASELEERFEDSKEDIKNHILCLIEKDKRDFVDSGEMTIQELEETEEYQELLSDLALIENSLLNPVNDLDYYCNCLDTHVYMPNIDFYRRYMEKEVDDIENKMGWCFGEI